jgi:hypothetical protein
VPKNVDWEAVDGEWDGKQEQFGDVSARGWKYRIGRRLTDR